MSEVRPDIYNEEFLYQISLLAVKIFFSHRVCENCDQPAILAILQLGLLRMFLPSGTDMIMCFVIVLCRITSHNE